MSRMSPTMSGLTREPDVKSSQQPSLRLPVQNGVRTCNNTENVVLSKESQLLRYGAGDISNSNHGSRENRISGQSEKKQPSILLARWTCPPKFILNENWHVVAGEESEEVKVQEQREARLNQLIYPHPSAIPPSPPVSFEGDHLDDDETTPIIPTIEQSSEDEAPSSTNGVLNSMASASELGASKPCTGAKDPVAEKPGFDADVGAAASAAFTALMKSYEQGNLIDTELLINLLNDPKMIELLKNTRPLANSDLTQSSLNTPSCVTTSVSGTASPSAPLPHSTRPNVACESFLTPVPMPPASSTAIFARPPSTFPQKPISTDSVSPSADKSSSSVKAPPPMKDVSYLKSLVRQHGVERPEVEGPRSKPKTSSSSPSYSPSLRESRKRLRHPGGQGNKKPKASSKPCMYFSSPKGCRLGLSCPFRHELPHRQPRSASVSGASGFKRIKL